MKKEREQNPLTAFLQMLATLSDTIDEMKKQEENQRMDAEIRAYLKGKLTFIDPETRERYRRIDAKLRNEDADEPKRAAKGRRRR